MLGLVGRIGNCKGWVFPCIYIHNDNHRYKLEHLTGMVDDRLDVEWEREESRVMGSGGTALLCGKYLREGDDRKLYETF